MSSKLWCMCGGEGRGGHTRGKLCQHRSLPCTTKDRDTGLAVHYHRHGHRALSPCSALPETGTQILAVHYRRQGHKSLQCTTTDMDTGPCSALPQTGTQILAVHCQRQGYKSLQCTARDRDTNPCGALPQAGTQILAVY